MLFWLPLTSQDTFLVFTVTITNFQDLWSMVVNGGLTLTERPMTGTYLLDSVFLSLSSRGDVKQARRNRLALASCEQL